MQFAEKKEILDTLLMYFSCFFVLNKDVGISESEAETKQLNTIPYHVRVVTLHTLSKV